MKDPTILPNLILTIMTIIVFMIVVMTDLPDPVITVETPYGVATISGSGAEYVLHSAFPVIVD